MGIMDFSKLLAEVNNFVWGPVMLVLLVGTGIFLTVRLKFLPWRNLGYAIHMVFSKRDKHAGDISPFQSLMTALSATIGTGNIVGVATAMVLGGPGALVWMWISAAFGLSTKYGEFEGVVFASAWKKAQYHDRYRGMVAGITVEQGKSYEFMMKKGIVSSVFENVPKRFKH